MKRMLLAGLLLCAADEAKASCVLPKLELLWSYPSNGAVDVPTNAELWALLPYAWGTPVVRLDGKELVYTPSASGGVVHAEPGSLAADHEYVLQLDFSQSQPGVDAGMNAVTEISFRTGSTTATRPLAPKLGSGTTAKQRRIGDELPSSCPSVLRAQTCLDTGPNEVHRFEVLGEVPLAWLVDDHVLPPPCQRPELLAHVSASGRCASVRAIGAGGLLSEASEACYERDMATASSDASSPRSEPDAGAPRTDAGAESDVQRDGCNLRHGQGGLALLLLALLRLRGRGRAVARSRAPG